MVEQDWAALFVLAVLFVWAMVHVWRERLTGKDIKEAIERRKKFEELFKRR